MNIIQLDLFQKPSEIELVRMELEEVRESSSKVRKALFARHNELAKLYLELHNRLEVIERNICHEKR